VTTELVLIEQNWNEHCNFFYPKLTISATNVKILKNSCISQINKRYELFNNQVSEKALELLEYCCLRISKLIQVMVGICHFKIMESLKKEQSSIAIKIVDVT